MRFALFFLAEYAGMITTSAVCVALFFTLWDLSIQEQIPPRAVSRVSAYDFTVSMGLMPLGMAICGPIADATAIRTDHVAAATTAPAMTGPQWI